MHMVGLERLNVNRIFPAFTLLATYAVKVRLEEVGYTLSSLPRVNTS